MANNYKYKGIWSNIINDNDQLKQDYGKILRKDYSGTTYSAMSFLHGWCTYYAYILSQKYNLTIYVVRSDDYGLLHAYCVYVDDDGKEWYLDVRGATTNEELFFDEFEIDINNEDYYIWEWYECPNDLEEFIDNYEIDKSNPKYHEIFKDAQTFINLL